MGIIQNSAINLPNQIEKKVCIRQIKLTFALLTKKEFIDAIS